MLWTNIGGIKLWKWLTRISNKKHEGKKKKKKEKDTLFSSHFGLESKRKNDVMKGSQTFLLMRFYSVCVGETKPFNVVIFSFLLWRDKINHQKKKSFSRDLEAWSCKWWIIPLALSFPPRSLDKGEGDSGKNNETKSSDKDCKLITIWFYSFFSPLSLFS